MEPQVSIILTTHHTFFAGRAEFLARESVWKLDPGIQILPASLGTAEGFTCFVDLAKGPPQQIIYGGPCILYLPPTSILAILVPEGEDRDRWASLLTPKNGN